MASYKSIQLPYNDVQGAYKYPTIFDNVPTKRGELYEKLGINRAEGAKLCNFLGFGVRTPLSSSQVDSLTQLVNSFHPWKQRGHSVETFLKHYGEIYRATNATTTGHPKGTGTY